MAQASGSKRKSSSVGGFKDSWEDSYLFIEQNSAAKCLVCNKTLQIKKYNLQRHYALFHAKDFDKLNVIERASEIHRLKGRILEEAAELLAEGQNENVIRCSYQIALKIAKHSRPFTDGEFVKDCLVQSAEQLCPESAHLFGAISVSRTTVMRRIQEMATNVCEQIRAICGTFIAYSLALDESTDISGTPNLAIFIRGVDIHLKVTEELLDFFPLKETTTGEDIICCVEYAVEQNNLEWHKLVCVTTDGAPAMVGKYIGFVGRLRTKLKNLAVPHDITAIHCAIHQQNLCSKHLEIDNVMSVVVRVTNYIRTNGLKRRQFKTFLEDLHSEYGDLPFYTEVRWLSRGKLLDRFFKLREVIAVFMETATKPAPELQDPTWICDLAFLTDIVHYLNSLNITLQGRTRTIIDYYRSIDGFKAKLQLWMAQFEAGNAYHFPNLLSVLNGNADLQRYRKILNTLHEQFLSRFEDLTALQSDFDILTVPFSIDVNIVPLSLQLELIDLQRDVVLKHKFFQNPDIVNFYQNFPQSKYPKIHKYAARILAMFGSTYICEQLFSVMKRTKSVCRTTLTDYNLKCSLILSTCQKVQPNITQLVEEKRAAKQKCMPDAPAVV